MANLKVRILKANAVFGMNLKPGDEIEVVDRDTAATAVRLGVAEIVKVAGGAGTPLPAGGSQRTASPTS